MIDKNKLPYRKCVGMMLVNKNGLVFVAKRIDNKAEAWQMPQGGVDDGEDVENAALRELEEEIGTRNARIIKKSDSWLPYDLPDHLIGKIWNGKYRGQTQKWFLMEFLGDDSDINIATKHPEFSEWKWIEQHLLPDIIVPFKKELYIKVLHEFREYL